MSMTQMLFCYTKLRIFKDERGPKMVVSACKVKQTVFWEEYRILYKDNFHRIWPLATFFIFKLDNWLCGQWRDSTLLKIVREMLAKIKNWVKEILLTINIRTIVFFIFLKHLLKNCSTLYWLLTPPTRTFKLINFTKPGYLTHYNSYDIIQLIWIL